MASSNNNVVLSPVAVGLPSPAGQNPRFYHYLSPFTAATTTTTTTPSPYANSLPSSTTATSKPALLRHLGLILRALSFFLSFASSLSLALPRPAKDSSFHFLSHSDFSEVSFWMRSWGNIKQVVAYLLISSASVSASASQDIPPDRFRCAAIASTIFSFAAFLAIAASALLAGYRLCKRLIW
ncbi:hypothetical protein Cni_G06426 [Canna indica]|uniref:CASP-like protein n=1 Tax=Canna indica TaxID=4628 RepID=A0AAQ3Q4R6_9LILI|nr:hypothetical protein Cni_G06426 [Canna indica]